MFTSDLLDRAESEQNNHDPILTRDDALAAVELLGKLAIVSTHEIDTSERYGANNAAHEAHVLNAKLATSAASRLTERLQTYIAQWR